MVRIRLQLIFFSKTIILHLDKNWLAISAKKNYETQHFFVENIAFHGHGNITFVELCNHIENSQT